ncbi:IS66 family insertion sequence element accessory protein TnpA [Lacrimispora sp.]|uniref:IS66 family insertion sequence element accessory protein TnpA n=1 Tax=Lacrimispora sp. TaxID=2719234 RepID=UPI002861B0A9|nr:IS66 family insertion sequence element accessory protein TnpB [Lacrimispora sp.]MDR7815161.1 IS66 family insertion sequence element accessory protein TnpB [Lacrimispora sp.]
MNTRLATNQIRLSEWTRIIKDRCQSGLKVDEYCEQHQLSRHAYYYWLRKVKEAALIHNSFVELPALQEKTVPATTSENHFIYQMTVTIGNTVLGVSESTPMELLSRVLEVVRNA